MNNLNDSIITRLKQSKPKPSILLTIRNYLFGFIMVILLGLGAVSLGSFVVDSIDLVNIFSGSGIDNIWDNLLLELLVFSSLAGIMIYVLYRQTDWPAVRSSKFLLTLIALFIVIGGGLLAWAEVNNDSINLSRSVTTKIPFRAERQARIQNFFNKRQLFVGHLTNLTQNKANDRWTLIIRSSKAEQKTFIWESKVKPKLTKGRLLVIKYEDKSEYQAVVEAKYVVNMLNNYTETKDSI